MRLAMLSANISVTHSLQSFFAAATHAATPTFAPAPTLAAVVEAAGTGTGAGRGSTSTTRNSAVPSMIRRTLSASHSLFAPIPPLLLGPEAEEEEAEEEEERAATGAGRANASQNADVSFDASVCDAIDASTACCAVGASAAAILGADGLVEEGGVEEEEETVGPRGGELGGVG